MPEPRTPRLPDLGHRTPKREIGRSGATAGPAGWPQSVNKPASGWHSDVVALGTLTRLVAVAAGTLFVVGCSDSSEAPDAVPAATLAPTSSEVPESLLAEKLEADIRFRLDAGSSAAQGHFDAPDPRTHTQTIEVTVDPGESPVVIDFTTTTGSTLHVLGLERYDSPDCRPEDDRTICIIRFPILEAQRSGRWTATASKADGPAAAVEVRVRWEAVSNL